MKFSEKVKEIHEMFEVKDGDIIEVRGEKATLYQINDLMLEELGTGEQRSIACLSELEYIRLYTPINHRTALEILDNINNEKVVTTMYDNKLCQIDLDDDGYLLEMTNFGVLVKTDLVVGLYSYDCFVETEKY